MFNILTSTQKIVIELINKTFISISAYPSVGTVIGVAYIVLIFTPNATPIVKLPLPPL